MKTYVPKKTDVREKWYLVDAKDQILGRLATRIAKVLRGKNEPTFTPHVDPQNFVVVVNADKIKLTGNKLKDKVYYHHTGWVGGIKGITAEKLLEKNPPEVIKKAVKGMLPHNKLNRQIIKHLKIYAKDEHPHKAQKPETIDLHTRQKREKE